MKEAFDLIKERLKEADKYHDRIINLGDALRIVSEVEAEYNKKFEPTFDLIEYGVDGFNLYLKEQYRKGYEDAKAEYGNGWIPVEKALPKERDWYLAMFKEPDTGFMGLPFIADYLMGVHTNYTTEDGWIIANCTDIEDERAEYYKKLVCVAWMPLPEPWKGEQG